MRGVGGPVSLLSVCPFSESQMMPPYISLTVGTSKGPSERTDFFFFFTSNLERGENAETYSGPRPQTPPRSLPSFFALFLFLFLFLLTLQFNKIRGI